MKKCVFVLFLFLYNFAIIPFPRQVRSGIILSLILILISFRKGITRKIPLFLGRPFLCYSILFLISIAFYLYNSLEDITVPVMYVCNILMFIGAYFICRYFYKDESPHTFLEDVLKIIFIQSIIILVMFFIPTIGEWIRYLIRNDELFELYAKGDIEKGFRGNGISGSLVWDFGVQQSLGLVVAAYLMRTSLMHNALYYVVAYLFIFASVLMTGRSGLIGVGISCIVFMWRINIFVERIRKYVAYKFFIVVIMFSSIVSVYIANSEYEYIFRYGLEFFYNLEEKGEFSSESTNSLFENHLRIDPDYNIITGSGKYMNDDGSYYGDTDCGYIRHAYYYGILSFILYGLIFYLFYRMIRNIPSQYSLMKLMYISIFVFYMVLHVKGDFLLASYQNLNYLFLSYFFFEQHRRTYNI